MVIKYSNPHPDYDDLTLSADYLVIGIEADDFRILNDRGQPYLYPNSLFKIIDPREPREWVVEIGDDGERYAYPPQLNAPGFFEDFFDSNRVAVANFWRTINAQLTIAAAA